MLSSRTASVVCLVGIMSLPACGLVTGSTESVGHPRFENGGLLADATPLSQVSASQLEGLWDPAAGGSLLGSSLVLHGSPGYVSLFGDHDATYAVFEAGCLDDGRLVLEGYHRTAIDTSTGLVRLFVEPAEAAQAICGEKAVEGPLRLAGSFGNGSGAPDQTLSLVRQRLLPTAPATMVIAHRGGCRSSDDCGASENSLEMLRMAQRLGADRIEVDVQVTSDGVPILYHDPSFGPLLTSGRYCRGAVSDFTWAHVTQLCKLRYGEWVPRLDDALRTVVEETELVGLWLDVKTPTGMNAALPFVRKWNQIAAGRGRNLRIVVGLSTEDLVNAWLERTDVSDIECLVEVGVDELRRTGCHVWGPRWTLGPMASTVAQVQAEGHTVAFWTLDDEQFIDLFIHQAKPNGLLTNRPGLVLQRSYIATIQAEGEAVP
jgi:glycerophosphoryl diester phosphodiesterase